jgi:UDP-N-acetylmuramate dehydrogenase
LSLSVLHDFPLAPLTTLELGGHAHSLIEATDEQTVIEALAWAQARGLPVLTLGGGSNVVIADAGFPGLVIRIALRGASFEPDGALTLMHARAGEPWDGLIAETVRRGLAGLECLSGIPGLVGATPIQNVGAYGQEVAETIRAVRVVDRRSNQITALSPSECTFSYRDSAFKRDPDRWIVLGVTFALRRDGVPHVGYRELEQALAAASPQPTLAQVRDTVIALRRGKSMVIDAGDANRRSVGSFFTNPIVPAAEADRLVARLLADKVVPDAGQVPRFPAGPDRIKLSAGWLIERAGWNKGFRRGAVGISSRHALALVHHGGGTTADLLALADDVRDAVAARFGVTLAREPVVVAATEQL